ncbi:hypothetical protein [Deinococcus malanensis]|uniref:hypothetical protein n=1 Tax=Deinococcus malanensis TaxID=1706855 RepID=UPI00166D8A58|nr:hypothetical protein [Deinococcus malanensis]
MTSSAELRDARKATQKAILNASRWARVTQNVSASRLTLALYRAGSTADSIEALHGIRTVAEELAVLLQDRFASKADTRTGLHR